MEITQIKRCIQTFTKSTTDAALGSIPIARTFCQIITVVPCICTCVGRMRGHTSTQSTALKHFMILFLKISIYIPFDNALHRLYSWFLPNLDNLSTCQHRVWQLSGVHLLAHQPILRDIYIYIFSFA